MSGYAHELEVAVAAARAAGDAVMAVYGQAAVYQKNDGSEVTEADLASDRLVRAHLAAAFPGDAILTEEGIDDRARLLARRCWIVDPIDGTAAFVRRTGEFDVYIALVVDGSPVVAATLQPATGLLLTAVAGAGASMSHGDAAPAPLTLAPAGSPLRLGTRPWLGAPANLPLLDEVANRLGDAEILLPDALNVRSLIGGRVVDAVVGLPAPDEELDAWEWDIAAVDLIVREAGGCSTDLDGAPLRFNRPNPRLAGGLLWSADPATHARVLDAIRLTGR